MKKTLIIALLAVVALATQAKDKTVIWEKPTVKANLLEILLGIKMEITRVEFAKDETRVMAHVTLSSKDEIGKFSTLQLMADNKRYTLKETEGEQPGKDLFIVGDRGQDVVFHFEPLPKKTTMFILKEGVDNTPFQLLNIMPEEESMKENVWTHWRNEKSGDCEISILDNHAIYSGKIWNCNKTKAEKDQYSFTLENDDKEIAVEVGKSKNGIRAISIDGKQEEYSMITSLSLPDYPQKDTQVNFKDTHYQPDTTTVSGVLVGLPDVARNKLSNKITIETTDLFQKDPIEYSDDIDSLGRFEIKMPLLNTSQVNISFFKTKISVPVEPGETYMIVFDIIGGQHFFMGKNSRVQNELIRYPLDNDKIKISKGGDIDKYIAQTDSLLRAKYADIDMLCQKHPTLSTRFCNYQKGNSLCNQASAFMRARFETKEGVLPDNARQYAYNTFMSKLEEPYTLHNEGENFLKNYLEHEIAKRSYTYSWTYADHIEDIASDEEELALLTRWSKFWRAAVARVEKAPTQEEKEQIAKEENEKNADLIKEVNKILNDSNPRMERVGNSRYIMTKLKDCDQRADSLGIAPILKDVLFSHFVYDYIEEKQSSLTTGAIDTFKTVAQNPMAIKSIENLNNKYIATENIRLDKQILKSSDDLKDISDGKQLLQKILEPYKGKIVLLDIWGTWCGPCKEALSHSQEEYKRLKGYNMAYVYLANSSPIAAWEYNIKKYKVSGENVAHYNLPKEQQKAIEEYIGIEGYPTFKLFDREGNMLDLEVDSRYLDELEKALKGIK